MPLWRAVRVVGPRGGAGQITVPRGAVRRPRPRAASGQGALPRHRRGGPARSRLGRRASAASASPASRGSSRSTSTGWSADAWWHRGRCLAYGEGVAFWALAEMVRLRAGILEDEDSVSASAKLRAADRDLHPRSERAALRRAAPRASARSRGARRARPGEPLRRLEAPLRAHVRGASGHSRLRGHPLGRQRAPRLRRVPRRLGEGPPGLHPHAGPPGACRPATDLGRRQAGLQLALPRSAPARRDGSPPHGPGSRPARRSAATHPRARRGSPVLCGRDRAHAARSRPDRARGRRVPTDREDRDARGAGDAPGAHRRAARRPRARGARLLQDASVLGRTFTTPGSSR